MRFRRSVTYFCTFLLLSATSLQAQLRFTKTDTEKMFTSGVSTNFEANGVAGTIFNLGHKGSGNTWDYTGYEFTGTQDERTAINPLQTPYASLFPNATHALRFGEDEDSYSYAYFLLNDDGMYSLGVGSSIQGQPFMIFHNPPLSQYLFPLQEGSEWTYSGDPFEPIEGFISQTEMTVEVISSGTLITNHGSSDALCVKSIRRETTRVEFDGQVFSESYTTTVSFMFLTKSGITASLYIDTLDVDSMTPVIQGTAYTVDGAVNNVSSLVATNSFSLEQAWPNPAQSGDMLNVSWKQDKSADIRISIYDMLGRELNTVYDNYAPAGSHTLSVPVNDIPAGMYILRGHSAGSNDSIQRITVIR